MKNPAILIAAAGALLLLGRKANAAAPPLVVIKGQPTAQDYPTPGRVAEALAAPVLNMIFGRTGIAATAPKGSTGTGTEDARNAVRAGDTYYGGGAVAWYANNNEAARAAVREGDAYYSTWTKPADVPTTNWASPAAEIDGFIAAPFYSASDDLNLAGLF